MSEKSEFAIKTLKQYVKENQVLPRSTSDLSKLEEWLILQLFEYYRKDKASEIIIKFLTDRNDNLMEKSKS